MSDIRLIQGQRAFDDRGSVAFVNDFHFDSVRRFYTVTNHRVGFVRAWHGHKSGAKYCTVVHGVFLVCGIKLDDWSKPSPDLPVQRFIMSADQPSVLCIPPGYVNGAMSLTEDATIQYFSTTPIEDASRDDFRFPARLWDPWQIKER